jgi:hypothetical protein
MLAVSPPPSAKDIAARSAREPMTGADRWNFFNKYAPGLTGIILVYLFVTLLRSVRADFAVELWSGLGYHQTPAIFTQSELLVSFAVIIIIGLAVVINNHYKAFHFSLLICFIGFTILLLTIAGFGYGLPKFAFMVLIGLGVYMPYVAIHAIVFERLIAVTKEKANVGFLMYIVDSVGYTGYIGLMLLHYLTPAGSSILSIFIAMCVYLGVAGLLLILFCYLYFKFRLENKGRSATLGVQY